MPGSLPWTLRVYAATPPKKKTEEGGCNKNILSKCHGSNPQGEFMLKCLKLGVVGNFQSFRRDP